VTQPEKKTAVHRRKVASYYVSELSHRVLPVHALAVHPGQQLAFLCSLFKDFMACPVLQ
jgi:hypothetical protein